MDGKDPPEGHIWPSADQLADLARDTGLLAPKSCRWDTPPPAGTTRYRNHGAARLTLRKSRSTIALARPLARSVAQDEAVFRLRSNSQRSVNLP
jgi:hypothetical protein